MFLQCTHFGGGGGFHVSKLSPLPELENVSMLCATKLHCIALVILSYESLPFAKEKLA